MLQWESATTDVATQWFPSFQKQEHLQLRHQGHVTSSDFKSGLTLRHRCTGPAGDLAARGSPAGGKVPTLAVMYGTMLLEAWLGWFMVCGGLREPIIAGASHFAGNCSFFKQ